MPHPKWAKRHPKKYCPCTSQVGWSFRQNLSYIYLVYLVVFVSVPSVTITEGFRNHSESLLLFLFHGTEFRDVFSSAEGFGTEFQDFLFGGTAGIPPEIAICSVYFVFRGLFFCLKYPTLDTPESIWATLHPKSYAAPSELSCTLLIYAAPFWSTLHPIWTSLRPKSYASPSELSCNLLRYAVPFWATEKDP